MGTYDDTPVPWGKRLTTVAEVFVGEAVGAALYRVGEGTWSVEFRDKEANVKGVRPATPLEVRMWEMLTAANANAWGSAYYESNDGTQMGSMLHPSTTGTTEGNDGA